MSIPALGATAGQDDPKAKVHSFCMKKLNKQITKQDISYNTLKHGGSYQATISLVCLGGVAFVGELCGNAKDAERKAAEQVLKHFAEEIVQLNAMPKVSNKRPATAVGGTGILQEGAMKAPKVDPGPKPPKQKINEMCISLAKRVLSKDDVKYDCKAVAGGFQSTLTLACLPGAYAGVVFTGGVSQTKKEAETAVAQVATETMEADDEIKEMLAKKTMSQGWKPHSGWGSWGKGTWKKTNVPPAPPESAVTGTVIPPRDPAALTM